MNPMRNQLFKNVRHKLQGLDWELFWLLEVLVLAVPFLVAILLLPHHSYLGRERLAPLISLQLCATVLNVVWASHRHGRHI